MAPITHKFTHKIISNLDALGAEDLRELEESWDALAEIAHTPLLSFDWFVVCATTIHADDELRITVVRDHGEICAIAPLFVQRAKGFRRLEILGVSVLYEPSGFLYENRSALSYLLNTIVCLDLPISLGRIPDSDTVHLALREIGMRHGIGIGRNSAPSTFIETDQGLESLLGSMSPKRRYDLRRGQRRASQIGEIGILTASPELDDFDKLFDIAVEIEDASWKGDNRSSMRRSPHLLQFFRIFGRRACNRGILRIFFLSIDQVPVATLIALQANQSLWILKIGYSSEFSRCSPGIALSHASIKYCIENGLQRYEFLGSEEPWQSTWPIKRRSYSTLLFFPWSLAGVSGLISVATEYIRRTLSRRLNSHLIRNRE